MSYPLYYYSLRADIQPSYKDSLTHHGIKGMHWGVRRFQNPDGTLTPEGEKRYLKNLNKASQNEMVSDFFARGYTKNYEQLSELKRTDPEYYKKKVPKGLLEKQKSEMDKWIEQNKKDVETVKMWINKINLDKKHLVYDATNNTYYIEED